MDIPYIDQHELSGILDYPELIESLKLAFREDRINTPTRHHHDYKNPASAKDSTLLVMPSWEEGDSLGVKLVTINPENQNKQLPSIQGVYVLFDKDGTPKLILDAKELTVRRTAATSALASGFLSGENSRTLMIIGTGALSPELIKAHSSVRKIEKVLVWGRNPEKARGVANMFDCTRYEVIPIDTIEEGLQVADIISVATLSETPLVFGKHLRAGQHLDLIGSYKPTMREADDETIKNAKVYIDSEMALKESGDLALPIASGTIEKNHIIGTLFDLCQGKVKGRKSETEITYFKSVGHALEDLVAARLVCDRLIC